MKNVLFHVVNWHGKDGPSQTGYDSRDPITISHQLSAMAWLSLMMRAPKFGVVLLTYGPTVSPFIHAATKEWVRQCNLRQVTFALCFDPWTVKGQADKNAAMIAALKHPDTAGMLASPNYLLGTVGKPVLDFGTGVDVSKVTSGVAGIEYWQNGREFAWIRFPSTAADFKAENATAKLPIAFPSFDDGTGADRNKQAWDQSQPVRLALPRAGGLWWDMIESARGQDWIQVGTWNDVAENPVTIETFASMLWGRI